MRGMLGGQTEIVHGGNCMRAMVSKNLHEPFYKSDYTHD